MKNKNILVDTSAWIKSFKKSSPEPLKILLKEAIDNNRIISNSLIILELLQGCKTQKEFDLLKARLECLEICPLEDLSWDSIYRLSFSLRRKGITVSTIDLILASVAIEKKYILLHHDHHFRMIAENSDLEIIDFLD